MFSGFKFPTLRQKGGQRDSISCEEPPYCYHSTSVKNKPPKTPTLTSSRVKRHQRRRSEPGAIPSVCGFTTDSAARDRLAPGDRLLAVDGASTARLSNDDVLRLLDQASPDRAELDVEYYLPEYASASSLYVRTAVADVCVERGSGGCAGGACAGGGALGLTLRGGGVGRSLLVTHIRAGSPAHRTARLKPGDRLLCVDHVSLSNKTLSEVYEILQAGNSSGGAVTTLTIEYDVQLMESVRLATGPLLVELERPPAEELGLVFVRRVAPPDDIYAETAAVYIDAVVPASIADRCGALHAGDRVLAVDGSRVDGRGSQAAEEVSRRVRGTPRARTTMLRIAPAHTLTHTPTHTPTHPHHQHHLPYDNSVSGTSTLNSRRYKQNRNYRQSSVPKMQDDYDWCRSQPNWDAEIASVEADADGCVDDRSCTSLQITLQPGQSSGVVARAGPAGELRVAHVTIMSPAYRTGCIQPRDRILSINGHSGVSVDVANDVLQRRNDSSSPKYIHLQIEFLISHSVEAAQGVFNVKLAKNSAGLGVTITGNKQAQGQTMSPEPMVISHILCGSAAHRCGALNTGDQLLAVNGQPLHNLSLDTAFNILQNSPDDIITLKVRKLGSDDWSGTQGSLSSFHVETNALVHGQGAGGTQHRPTDTAAVTRATRHDTLNDYDLIERPERLESCENGNSIVVFTVDLVKQDAGPLGLTIAGSEDASQAILLSGLVEGGVAEKSGKLKIGDEILSINGESVLTKPLSQAIKLLQNNNQHIQLKISRKVSGLLDGNINLEMNCLRDSNLCSNHSNSSPGLSNDSAVESWDQNTPVRTSGIIVNNETVEYAVPDKSRIISDNKPAQQQPYSHTDEDKLLAFRNNPPTTQPLPLPLPDYTLNNSLKSFHYDTIDKHLGRKDLDHRDANQISLLSDEMNDCQIHQHTDANKLRNCKCDYVPMAPYAMASPNTPTKRNHWDNDNIFNFNMPIYNTSASPATDTSSPRTVAASASYQQQLSQGYDSDVPGVYNSDSGACRGSVHHVTLYKDAIYDDYGFSVSDGLYERGVYINRIRQGGPADIVGLLKPYDRILQVNGTKTMDYDCCLTVPLIASAGDRLEIVVHRFKEARLKDEEDSSQIDSHIVTKTI